MPISLTAGISLGDALQAPSLPRLEVRILLAHALDLSRLQLITQAERILTAAEVQHISALFARRAHGEPIAYIVGQREFFGLSFQVSPAVLIPRPETELLVELTLERLPTGGRLLDLGTGSGAIAVAVAHARADAVVTAVDISTDALAVARHNAARHHVALSLLQSDWYQSLNQQHFELIVANPPYIVEADTHLSQGDLRFEPADALTDHADGLSAIRTIIADAPRFLMPNGWLLVEHGYDQAPAVNALMMDSFDQVQSWKDLAGIDRVTGGRMKNHPQAQL